MSYQVDLKIDIIFVVINNKNDFSLVMLTFNLPITNNRLNDMKTFQFKDEKNYENYYKWNICTVRTK